MTAEFDGFGHGPSIYVPKWVLCIMVIIMLVFSFALPALVFGHPKDGCKKISANKASAQDKIEHFNVKTTDGIYHIYLEFE